MVFNRDSIAIESFIAITGLIFLPEPAASHTGRRTWD